MAEVVSVQPAVLARGIFDRLTQMARADEDAARAAESAARAAAAIGGVDGPDAAAEPVRTDDRTLDQRRADIFADMMLAGAPVAVRRRHRRDPRARAGHGSGAHARRCAR